MEEEEGKKRKGEQVREGLEGREDAGGGRRGRSNETRAGNGMREKPQGAAAFTSCQAVFQQEHKSADFFLRLLSFVSVTASQEP